MKRITLTFTLFLAMAVATPLHAQVSAFTYQGRLDLNGAPANGYYDFMFRLLNDPTNGVAAPVIPVNPAVLVTNGLFTTGMDFGTENFNDANRWLEINVRTNGPGVFATLSPRQLLTVTPYAVKALEAATVPPNTITSTMLADGAVTKSKIAVGAVNQLGSPDGSPTDAVQVNTNGLVGVGTNAPAAGLHITASQSFLNPEVLSVRVDEIAGYTNLNAARGVAVQGNLAAVAGFNDSGITLLGVATPASPTLLAQFRDGDSVYTNLNGAISVALKSNLLVVAAYYDSSVTLISVSNPASPVKLTELRDGVGGWNELNGAISVTISGNLLAIAAKNDSAVTLVDISNPALPIKRAELKNGVFGFDHHLLYADNVALSGNLLAIASGGSPAHVLTLVDVTNPNNPVKRAELDSGLGGYNYISGIFGLALSSNLLAVASISDSAVTLVDVNNPASPVKLAELRDGVNADFLAGAAGVAFSGNILAVSAYVDNAVTVFDVSNPTNPTMLAVARHGVGGFNKLTSLRELAFADSNILVASPGSSAVTMMRLVSRSAGLSSQEWVGIGTVRPAGALHVVGDVFVEQANRIELNTDYFEAGLGTTASGANSTALGNNTFASGDFSTALGRFTTASGLYSTAMGQNTRASGSYATALGNSTSASGDTSTALGYSTTASGDYSTASGFGTTASGNYSFAAGRNAQATNQGALVWADSQGANFSSTSNNQFLIRAAGGVGIGTNAPVSTLHVNGTVTATAFSGSGGGLTGVNASALGGLNRSNYWQLGGNQISAGQFLGSQNNQPVEIRVNGAKTMSWSYASNTTSGVSPNLIGGFAGNFVAPEVVGAIIVGGGIGGLFGTNSVLADFGTVVGGRANTVSGPYAVAMGYTARASGRAATAVNEGTEASGSFSFAGGYGTIASGISSTAMGVLSSASGSTSTALGHSTVAAGYASTALGDTSTASGFISTAMGAYSTASGDYSTAIGFFAQATNSWGFAAGYRAVANHLGAFVWGDVSEGDITSTNDNSVTMRASGGYRLFTDSTATTGAFLAAGSGSWTSMSDRNAKENFHAADTREVLAKLAALPVQTWNYKSQGANIRHIGPMAQDFKAAFGLGESDTGISNVDADGVALAAIQGLNQKLEESRAENAELKKRLAALEQLVQKITPKATQP